MPSGLPDRSSSISTGSKMAQTYQKILPTTPKKNTDANIKKVAITMPERKDGLLIQFDQTRPLENIIQSICEQWNVLDPNTYALRFNEQNQQLYITELNRKDIKDGQVLNLTMSAAKAADKIQGALKGARLEDKNLALRQLSKLTSDLTFAQEFIKIEGHQIVIDILTSGNVKGDLLSYALKSFVCVMEHGLLSWEILEPEFIRRVADCVNVSAHHLDTSCVQSALDILESVVLHCTSSQSVVEQVVTPINIIPHLETKNPEVQKNAIALINALFTRADEIKRKKIAESLQSKSMRNLILSNVIQGQTVGAGMAHELYVLQNHMLNLNDQRMRTEADINDNTLHREVEELRRIAFDVDDPNSNSLRKSQNGATEDFKKLGFQKCENPVEDLVTVPPGLLALDVMLYFARNHRENYVKVVVENSTRVDEHVCPFVQASKRLTKILCETLHIGDQPTENGETFYVMFFSHDRPFEEFFSICIQLLNKTWREMKATTQDFAKVLEVVKEQIMRGLRQLPSSFEMFRIKVNALSFSEISKIRESERREKEGQGAQLKPIKELRKLVLPEVRELVHQQRLNYLMAGSRFAKYSKEGKCKDKFWFWRLSHNHKALHYGDCGEADTSLDQLPNKLPVGDIQKMMTGKDCPHVNNAKARSRTVQDPKLAFSLKVDSDGAYADDVCFFASNIYELDMWTDGLNHLLGNQMSSDQVRKDEEILLSMEIKMRLLDTEGLVIPSEAPPLPPPPTSFNFAYLNL